MDHGLGGPTVTLALAACEAVAKMDVGAVNKQAMTKWLEENGAKAQHELEDGHIAYFRMQNTYGEKQVKFQVHFPDGELRRAWLECMKQVPGVVIKQGAAPPGPQEDEMAD
eukprot:271554-Alexandrium_andersonii.AAC.1